MERTSPGQKLGTHPFLKSEIVNSVLQATEFYQNTFLGRPRANQGVGGLLVGQASADIPAATIDGSGNIVPGTGDVTVWKFDLTAGSYQPTNIILPSGLVHNLSEQSVTAGKMLVLLARDGFWQIVFESCPAS